MKFRPCIDLKDGKVVQIVGSTIGSAKGPKENFVAGKNKKLAEKYGKLETSADYAKLYKRYDLPGGHIIMLRCDERAVNENAAVSALKTYPGGMQIGGGITADNAKEWLDYGASHVIVTSYVFRDGQINFDNLRKLKRAVGKKRLVLDLSCKKRDNAYYVVTDSWTKFTDYELNARTLDELAEYCSEFLIHAPKVEGKGKGMEEDLVENIGNRWLSRMEKPIPTTYAGGVKSLDEMNFIEVYGIDKLDVTVGSALDIFGGSLQLDDIAKWNHDPNFDG
jgi:phosphoribosylformimino-5-aminoimidazole carboxamide ribotide isomerase